MTLALFQNMGFWEWVFLLSLLYILFNRMSARDMGRAVGRAVSGQNPAEPGVSRTDLSACYKLLDVSESASDEQVRESYKNLVKVWHPDRFPNDAKLREKADQKLKEINAAYEKIMAARKL